MSPSGAESKSSRAEPPGCLPALIGSPTPGSQGRSHIDGIPPAIPVRLEAAELDVIEESGQIPRLEESEENQAGQVLDGVGE
jgi:hypothetical protein